MTFLIFHFFILFSPAVFILFINVNDIQLFDLFFNTFFHHNFIITRQLFKINRNYFIIIKFLCLLGSKII